jgi:hypothetical protein
MYNEMYENHSPWGGGKDGATIEETICKCFYKGKIFLNDIEPEKKVSNSSF